ncbi:MAG: hypothetical protein R2855_18590 [Thermomicrobiales bacterium]
MRISRVGRGAAGALLALMLAMGIVGSGVVAQDSTPEASADFPVTITFVNAMTSLDAVDVYINGDDKDQRVVEGLAYGDTSAEFTGTAPATAILVKQNVSWGIDRWLYNTLVPTEAGKSYVIVISDFVIIPVVLDTSHTVGATARTIGVNASSQSPALDVYATPSGQQFSIGNLVPLITNLQYGFSTGGGTADPGSYDLRATATGTDTVALQQDGVTIEANTSYVFVVIGKPGSTEQPLTLVTVSKPLSA